MNGFAKISVCSAMREQNSSQLGNDMDFHVIYPLLNFHFFEKMKGYPNNRESFNFFISSLESPGLQRIRTT